MFITVEGIDGAGKSTVIAALAEHLQSQGRTVWTTAEETARFGPAIRRSIKDGADPLVTAYLFLADRAAHVHEIRRHLDSGEVVICDRFAHSTLAYQSVTLDGMDDPVRFLRDLHAPLGLWPDRVILLDVPAQLGVKRAAGRGERAPYEKVAFLEKVRQAYLRLAEDELELIRVVDASGSPEDVAAAAVRALECPADESATG